MKLIIVRHGDPDYEKDSLTEKGFREAELLSDRIAKLDIKKAYCSPYGRAQDTSKPSLKKLGITAETLDWLKEFPGYIIDPATGEQRIPWDLLPSYWTKDERFYDRKLWCQTEIMKTGNVIEIYDMVCEKLDALLAHHGYERSENCYKAVASNTDTIILFCHFGIECVMLSHILGISPLVLWQTFIAVPSSVTTLITEERENGIASFRCNAFGDISHLYAAEEPPAFAGRFCETYANDKERH